MSRVGLQPIPLPSEVEATINGNQVTIKGPKGTLSKAFHTDMKIAQENSMLKVERPSDEREHRSLHGLTRSLLANMVVGVTQGYARTLELQGVGYRAQQSGTGILLSVMKSHTVNYQPREGITIEVDEIGGQHECVLAVSTTVIGSRPSLPFRL